MASAIELPGPPHVQQRSHALIFREHGDAHQGRTDREIPVAVPERS